MDIGWTPEILFPQRTGALKGAVLWDTELVHNLASALALRAPLGDDGPP